MTTATRAITVSGDIHLFDIPFLVQGSYEARGEDSELRFSVRVGDLTLGEVLRYILGMVGGPTLRLSAPWSVVEHIRLDQFTFEIVIRNGVSSYGFVYADLGLDLGFLQIDRLRVDYTPWSQEVPNPSLNVEVYGRFLGIDFTQDPIGWDALREQPPATPAGSDTVFRLDYMGLGQRVTLRGIDDLTTVGQVIAALRDSYQALEGEPVDPLVQLPALTFDDGADWLVGTQFSVLDTVDFSAIWSLPQLAGARIALRGDRAKSLAGLEFEILYRRISEDLGQYHIDLVLPDVLRKFQAGVASVTLPIIALDIYTDGGFRVDLGFPQNLDFSRAFAIELLVAGIPVTGAIGVYFGVLGDKAVPDLPAITGGDFAPVIVAGAGFRIGVGKTLNAGILEAGLFIGIEGLIEGALGFYTPHQASAPGATYFRLSGQLQLTGHIYGKVNFAIISASLDIYAYVSVSASFESYRATLLVFQAGVSLKLSVKINLGLFKVSISLSFATSIREELLIGQDSATPWQPEGGAPALAARIGPVGYRRLPGGQVIGNQGFARLLAPGFDLTAARLTRSGAPKRLGARATPDTLEVFFRPISTLGLIGDAPGQTVQTQGQVNQIATLMMRQNRTGDAPLSPAERFVHQVLLWGLDQVRDRLWAAGDDPGDTVTLSQLRYLADHLTCASPAIQVTPQDVQRFFTDQVRVDLRPADWSGAAPDLTPFPMIPFLTLRAGRGDDTVFEHDFQAGPMCSPAYQERIRAYFNALTPGDTPPSRLRLQDGPDLSMAELIFVDAFALVLGQITDQAIATLRQVTLPAEGRSLPQIAAACGMDHAAGRQQIMQANIDNPTLFAADSPVALAQDGMALTLGARLDRLAVRMGRPLLQVSRGLQSQDILQPDLALPLSGLQYQLTPDDTRAGLMDRFGITSWDAVEAANPGMDWSVPAPVPSDPRYPTLDLPAGAMITLPTVVLPAAYTHNLAQIVREARLPLPALLDQHPDLPLRGDGLARPAPDVTALAGETIADLAARLGLEEVETLADMLWDAPQIFAPDTVLAVPAASHVIARGDTKASIARRYQITIDALETANADAAWRFIPRPNTRGLPMGVTLNIPAVSDYRPARGATYQSIALALNLDARDLIRLNIDKTPLAAMARIPLPLWTVPADGRDAQDLAQPLGLDPVGLIRANQGTGTGPGSDVQLDRVLVPNCEEMPLDDLTNRLAGPGSEGALARAAQAMGRMVMAGLRLPDPGSESEDTALYPLYQLTGQQWSAPNDPGPEDWVTLCWNDSAPARRLGDAAAPVRVTLTSDDIALITGFQQALAQPETLQPRILARGPYPVLEQIDVQQRLGAATPLTLPAQISFDPAADGGQANPLLHDLPAELRRRLPGADTPGLPLQVTQITGDALIDQDLHSPLDNVGWATRIALQIRPTFGGADQTTRLGQTYEVLSITAQGQDDLNGLRQYLQDKDGAHPVDLYLLYPAGPLTPLAGSLRADALSPQDRARISLIKSNLSSFSRPATAVTTATMLRGTEQAAARLDQGAAFLDLLWQISVTNGGGFFLNYDLTPRGDATPGLPEDLFQAGETATVSVLVVLRASDQNPATVAPARFHNTLITAQPLASATQSLSVSAPPAQVTAQPGISPPVSASLQSLAELHGLGVAVLAQINASTPDLLRVGVEITGPDLPSYVTQIGDDLLTVAQTLGLSVAALGTQIAPRTDLLRLGASLMVRPGWVTPRARVAPDLGGFRLLRAAPHDPASAGIDSADIQYRIDTLFQMLGYRLAETEGFNASPQSLPILAEDIGQAPSARQFSLPAGTAQPWLYQRLLPLAPFAKTASEDPDPYAGLGATAQVDLTLQDVFGNALPSGETPLGLCWQHLYRDPIEPLHGWPGLGLAYDTARADDVPQIRARIKFAPAGYAPQIGVPAARLAQRLQADHQRYALIAAQVAHGRMITTLSSSLRPNAPLTLPAERVAQFARDIHGYLGVLRQLAPEQITLTADSTLADLAPLHGLDAISLGQHWAEISGLLRSGALLSLPRQQTILPDMSLTRIARQSGVNIQQLANWNADVPLTPGLALTRGDSTVETHQGDTLRHLAQGTTVATLARENAQVRGLFTQGSLLSLGTETRPILTGQTLSQIAAEQDLHLADLIAANASAHIWAPDQQAELPLHHSIPTGTGMTITVAPEQSLSDLADISGAAIRDLLSANGPTTGLLQAGAQMLYKPERGAGTEQAQQVGSNDTLSTIALRFARLFGDPSLTPADIGAYAANADNPDLLTPGARMLVPPQRINATLEVPARDTAHLTRVDLSVALTLTRAHPDLIAPSLRAAPDVARTRSMVPPRLSSDHSSAERGALLGFARQFQASFPGLKLAVGPDTVDADLLDRGMTENDTDDPPSRLVVVQWAPDVFQATAQGPATFFAPRPLANTPWSAPQAQIYPYVPGQPILSPETPPQTHSFANVDLERWAQILLRRIDRILQPDLVVPLRQLAPEAFDQVIAAKQQIAKAVADTVCPVIAPPLNTSSPPDPVSAGAQLRQQLLTELSGAYRGGVVIQYDVTATAPDLPLATAPRLLCQFAPRLVRAPGDAPTLADLADCFDAPVDLLAEQIQRVENLLVADRTLPLGSRPQTRDTDTLASLASRAQVTLIDLVDLLQDQPGWLRPGAGVPLARHTATTQHDDSLSSLLERLAPKLMAHQAQVTALDHLYRMNGTLVGVFVPGLRLTWQGKHHVTTASDTLASVCAALEAQPQAFLTEHFTTLPLLAPDITFGLLDLYPQATLSAGKISVTGDTSQPNKLNTVFVTATPDAASSVTLDLGYEVQAMEVDIAPAPSGSYQASDWLSFVDWRQRQNLGTVTIPIPDRQFPLPPVILSQSVTPQVKDGQADPQDLGRLMVYDYHLGFAFDAAPQDELSYALNDDPPLHQSTPSEPGDYKSWSLAEWLAQYQAVDAALWQDIDRLSGVTDQSLPAWERPVVTQALQNFATLAEQAAHAWAGWYDRPVRPAPKGMRIRRHRHPDRPPAVSISTPTAVQTGYGDPLPQLRLVHPTAPKTTPMAHHKRGEIYALTDPGLNLLVQQSCQGAISVTRNRLLVDGAETSPDFILHIPGVRAAAPVVPDFTLTQTLQVGQQVAPLHSRLEQLLNDLLFPQAKADPPDRQQISLRASFVRPLIPDADPLAPGLNVPVVTTPLVALFDTGEKGTTPAALAQRLAEYLATYLTQQGLIASESWSLALNLFGSDPNAPPLLLSLQDLRLRAASQ